MLYAAQIRFGQGVLSTYIGIQVMEYSCLDTCHGDGPCRGFKMVFFLKSLGGGSGSAERTYRRRTVDSECPKTKKTIQCTLGNDTNLTF